MARRRPDPGSRPRRIRFSRANARFLFVLTLATASLIAPRATAPSYPGTPILAAVVAAPTPSANPASDPAASVDVPAETPRPTRTVARHSEILRPATNPNPTPAAGAEPAYGCPAALAYLSAHAAPGFSLVCPAPAEGRQAMTCVNHAPECTGLMIIVIRVPCPAAYMNEANNSWVLIGRGGVIDPYGSC